MSPKKGVSRALVVGLVVVIVVVAAIAAVVLTSVQIRDVSTASGDLALAAWAGLIFGVVMAAYSIPSR
ncbi:hypothetical protein B9Q13_00665 [Candidatus Marsarchaeota G2 archaeon ECH_B_SAG-G16]|jgi:hypothetical protein|uniref:Uncharacterized protein n=2 Tax=Candidatus Marsarchaeota TaxID=1978152 RepID=A0A2R6AIK5_9ARCH|nr:MAG: hypothetical protein B9Q00_10550 [Candidatus Marsarchaeota G1 archaeon OSP_C]PSO05814.1 MAG: hypothetical protein B9Q13_00665 [Candidatus Marsarchaeota G2 archaeon ECH_B_SAG-G16]